MPEFIVTATQITNYNMAVEADSPEQAMTIAEENYDGWFDTGGEFTIDYAEEYKGE